MTQKLKVKDHPVKKLEWERTSDGRTETIALPDSLMRSVKINMSIKLYFWTMVIRDTLKLKTKKRPAEPIETKQPTLHVNSR